MLGFERRFVDALADSIDADEAPEVRRRVVEWVEGSLATMPQHLRLGVLAESVALAAYTALPGRSVERLPVALERSPLMPMRQYLRLFRSLVLFAQQELAPA